jgi:hypothetical protein
MNKTALTAIITLWATFDLPTLAGMLIFSTGLIMAAYILRRWGGNKGL